MTASKPDILEGLSLGPEFERAYEPIEHLLHPDAIILLDGWRAREAAGGLVVGLDLPSRLFSKVLRNLIVYEPAEDGRDFRVRLAGTTYLEHYGREVTGLLMSNLFDRQRFEYNCSVGYEVLRSNKPVLLDARFKRHGIEQLHYEIVLLPAWAPNKVDRWLICGVFRFS